LGFTESSMPTTGWQIYQTGLKRQESPGVSVAAGGSGTGKSLRKSVGVMAGTGELDHIQQDVQVQRDFHRCFSTMCWM
jgi:hypothetical protein